LLHKKGEAHLYKSDFARAKATFDAAVQIHKKISGMEDSIPLADSTCCLGVAYFYLNDFSHAKLLFQECMRILEKLVGNNDLYTVRSLCWLGRQHQKVNEPQKALERYLSALQICKRNKASVDYRLVVMLLHAIGKLYESDNVSFRETTSELQQLPKLPPELDPSRSNTEHQNANTSIDAEKNRMANIRVLRRIDSKVVDIAKTATQVALYEYSSGNQTSTAKKNGEGSLFITKQSDTPNMKLTLLNRSSKVILEVPITASFRLQLKSPYLMFRENPTSNGYRGIMFRDRNESDEIASYLEKVVKQEISLKCEWKFSNMAFQYFTRLSNFHSFAFICIHDVGYNEQISLINSKFDVGKIETTRMLVNAHLDPGILFKERGDTARSIHHLTTALELAKKCDDDKSLREGEISDHLGMLYASQSDFASAKLHYSTAYSVYEKTIGRDDLTTADCAFRLGGVLESLESNLALDFYKESLRVHRLNISEDNERVGDILCCLARLFLQSDSYQEAVGCFEEALSIRKRLLGDCSDVAETYHYLGKTYSDMSQNDKALIFYRESVRINKKNSQHDALQKVSLDMVNKKAYTHHVTFLARQYLPLIMSVIF
jgi:tetratricopeptide (TPR) repeat protein